MAEFNTDKFYQMDWDDYFNTDTEYMPVGTKSRPESDVTIFYCRKCGLLVGTMLKGAGYQLKKDVCKNGHKQHW